MEADMDLLFQWVRSVATLISTEMEDLALLVVLK